MSISGKDRLRRIEGQLLALGVKDVKFAWGHLDEKPLSSVINDVATVLEGYLAGKVIPLAPFGDAVFAHKPGCAVLSAAGNPACSCGGFTPTVSEPHDG